jgi:hypothetical protein
VGLGGVGELGFEGGEGCKPEMGVFGYWWIMPDEWECGGGERWRREVEARDERREVKLGVDSTMPQPVVTAVLARP